MRSVNGFTACGARSARGERIVTSKRSCGSTWIWRPRRRERRGESPERAARAARLKAGNLQHAMEALRDQRGLPWLDDLVRDLRHGGRFLARNKGFTAVAVVSLAIGIGANAAVFSFADALLLRPLPVPRPAEVLTVGSVTSVEGFSELTALVSRVRRHPRSQHDLRRPAGFTADTFGFAADAAAQPAPRSACS